MGGLKLDPKEVEREFGERAPDVLEAAKRVPDGVFKRAQALEAEWTEKGMPADADAMSLRLQFGFYVGQLRSAGVSKKLLLEYMEDIMEFIDDELF